MPPNNPLTLPSILLHNSPIASSLFSSLRTLDLYVLSLTCRALHSLLSSSTSYYKTIDISDIRYSLLPTRNVDMIPLSLRRQMKGWHVEVRDLHSFISRRIEIKRLKALVLDGCSVTRAEVGRVVKECKGGLEGLSVRWCVGINLAAVEGFARDMGEGPRRTLKFFGISAIQSFFLVESAEDLQTTLTLLSERNIATDVHLCPTCNDEGYTSVAICDDEEAVCAHCKLSVRRPISCLLCFRKNSCESCHTFYCDGCRSSHPPGASSVRDMMFTMVTIQDIVCTNNNYSRNHPWYSLPHRLCESCIERYGHCQKSTCQRLFCPLVDFAASIRRQNSSAESVRKKSITEAKSERYFERIGEMSCDKCGRRCCKECYTEEKYCRVCTTPGKTAVFGSRAGKGLGRKVFCNGCATFGRACVCQGYTCYKCVDEALEKEGSDWSWFRCQNCRWEDDDSEAKRGLDAASVPAIFGNAQR